MLQDPERFAKFFWAAWTFWFLFCLTLTGAGVYVAIHFIQKYW